MTINEYQQAALRTESGMFSFTLIIDRFVRIQIDRMLQAFIAGRLILLQLFMLASLTILAKVDKQVIISNRHSRAPQISLALRC